MNRFIIPCIFCLLLSSYVCAGSMHGYLIDATSNQPIPNASVELTKDEVTVKVTNTDNEGQFFVSGLQSGRYNLDIHAYKIYDGVSEKYSPKLPEMLNNHTSFYFPQKSIRASWRRNIKGIAIDDIKQSLDMKKIRLARDPFVRCRLEDGKGNGIPGVCVGLSHTDRDFEEPYMCILTDSNGIIETSAVFSKEDKLNICEVYFPRLIMRDALAGPGGIVADGHESELRRRDVKILTLPSPISWKTRSESKKEIKIVWPEEKDAVYLRGKVKSLRRGISIQRFRLHLRAGAFEGRKGFFGENASADNNEVSRCQNFMNGQPDFQPNEFTLFIREINNKDGEFELPRLQRGLKYEIYVQKIDGGQVAYEIFNIDDYLDKLLEIKIP